MVYNLRTVILKKNLKYITGLELLKMYLGKPGFPWEIPSSSKIGENDVRKKWSQLFNLAERRKKSVTAKYNEYTALFSDQM